MDTVILKIYGPGKFTVDNISWFLPELIKRDFHTLTPTERLSNRPYLRHFVFHPPYAEGYLPRIEVYEAFTEDRKGLRYILKLEFSVPKLLYGNSLQEVVEEDKDLVFSRLQSALGKNGIHIRDIAAIAGARVGAVHFCKNIPLPRDMRMREILDELRRVDISKVVDITGTKFKNGGRVLNIYSGTVERSFYDKVSDAMRPKNKRSDKGRIERERSIIERFGLQTREVFRYEYRIKKTQTVMRDINAALGRKDKKTYVAFADLFTPGLFKTMVLKSWRDLVKRPENQLALLGPTSTVNLFLHILAAARNADGKAHSLNNALVSYGLARAIGDHGAKEVRGSIFDLWNKDHPERLTEKIRAAAELTSGLPYSNCISFVEAELEKFECITRETLQNVV